MPSLPTFEDVLAAAQRIAPYATATPVLHSRTLDALAGCELHFKAEHLQRSGAFKFRGACNAARALAPACEVVLAEPAGAADTARSLTAGELRIDFVPDTICDGLRGTLGQPDFEVLRALGAQVVVVDDAAVIAAMRLLWQVLKQTVEPSAATVLAAVLAQPERFAGKRTGLVLSGGNVDIDTLPWSRA